MRKAMFLAMAAALGCGGGAETVEAQTTRVTVSSSGGEGGGTNAWIGGSPVRTRVVVGADGETYVGVWIDAPEAPGRRERPPMALSLVVDTSGSMSGAKIQNARIAASSLLESLQDGDIVSIYSFDNGVREIAPPTTVSQNTRGGLMQSVQYLHAGGGTNMYGGVQVGVNRLASTPASHSVRRLVLISDGHANIGPSDPYSLGNLAGNATEYNIQVTGIGVGLDYDENTLGALAVRSSGRLYHLEHAHQMAQILQQEVQLLASTVATDAIIEIQPGPGVTILEGVTTGATVSDGRLRVPLGSVYAGQQREILFRARVSTQRTGNRPLGTARFVYRTPDEDNERRTQEVALGYEVTRDQVAARGSAQPRVQAMVANYRAAEAQRQAAVALNNGNRAEAERQYEFAESALVEGSNVAPAAQREVMQQRLDRVRSTRSRARRATTPAAARGAALESFDAAMDAEGY